MDEIRRVLEEAAEDIDRKLERTESPEKEEHVDGSSGEDLLGVSSSSSDDDMVLVRSSSSDDDMVLVRSSDEDQGDDGKRKENEDEDETEEDDDDTKEDDDDTEEDPQTCRDLNPLDPRPLCTAGAGCTRERAIAVTESVHEKFYEMFEQWLELADSNITPLPARPVPILPEITTYCASGNVCYHREYWTDIISETEPSHPCFRPSEMLQVFSLRLSSTLSSPVNIYGTFAVRDCWEPRRNYLFNRSRDYPATIAPGCSVLPLCSPCRGIFVFQYVLLDIDLWIKEEGGVSPDHPLFSGYIELDAHWSGFESMLKGRIQDGPLGLDMHYAFLYDAIETVIEVLAAAENPSDVKISASTSGFDDEVVLYDGMFCGTGVIAKHFIAVRKLEKLHVFLKLDDSIYEWTFQAGVGVLEAPDGPVSGLAQFEVNVSF